LLTDLDQVKHLMDPPNPLIRKEEKGDHLKKDYGKLPWHLFPDDAAEEIVKVLEFGANKYSPRGWEEGDGLEQSLFCFTKTSCSLVLS